MNKNQVLYSPAVNRRHLTLQLVFFTLSLTLSSCNSKVTDIRIPTTESNTRTVTRTVNIPNREKDPSENEKPIANVDIETAHNKSNVDLPGNSKKLPIPDRIAVRQTLMPKDLYNLKAEALYNQGLRNRSIDLWEQILRDSPAHLPSINNLAIAYFNEKRFKNALVLFQRMIHVDKSWDFPYTRFFGPLAYYKQYGDLNQTHGLMLTEFLNRIPLQYRTQAKNLKMIALNKISSSKTGADQIGILRKKLAKNKRNIVHFWAEWCGPCLKELKDLFDYRALHPDINYLIVSIDSKHDKKRADKRLNAIFSPYKLEPTENLSFLFDAEKSLWRNFIPLQNQQVYTVPRTVFLNGTNQIEYIPRQVNWKSLDTVSVWKAVENE